MAIKDSEKMWEIRRLKEVIGKLKKKIAEVKPSLSDYRNNVIDIRRSIWEDLPHHMFSFDDIINTTQSLTRLDEETKAYQFKRLNYMRLMKLRSTPYFARIDFKEEGMPHPEMIYIGIHGFIDDDTREPLIYDWRAPVSSMFYDFGRGPAEYDTDLGRIKGVITLKRQFKIVSGQMEYMFDSDLKIDDEILQSILAKSADNRMRSIVTTIQREQNRVIRDEESSFLIVRGSAGSGKTSIALHRIAYLLYRYRDELNSRNMVILSPNEIFRDYISDVLPDLGEENILQMTFREYAFKALEDFRREESYSALEHDSVFEHDSALDSRAYSAEELSEQIEYILTGTDCTESALTDAGTTAGSPECESRKNRCERRIDSIRLKSSPMFAKLLKEYLKYLEEEKIRFHDIYFCDRILISEREIRELFLKDYKFLPIKKRLKKIRKRILYLLKPLKRERYKTLTKETSENRKIAFVSSEEMRRHIRSELRRDLGPIYSAIRRMVRFDALEAYICLFKDKSMIKSLIERAGLPSNLESDILSVSELTLKSLARRRILYEDIAPLLYLKGMIDRFPSAGAIRHLIIDEAQDYSPMQYELMAMLFPRCKVTLLGDLNQSINPYSGITDYLSIAEIFGAASISSIRLVKSYRSTKEIVEFTKGILKEGEPIEPIDRPGEKPLIIKAEGKAEKARLIIEDMKALKDKGASSVAVICKTAAEGKEAFDMISGEIDCTLITDEDGRLEGSTVIIPSYLWKGLEFDAVIIYDAGAETYSDEGERKLLYTACTRALHHLHLFHTGDITTLLGQSGL